MSARPRGSAPGLRPPSPRAAGAAGCPGDTVGAYGASRVPSPEGHRAGGRWPRTPLTGSPLPLPRGRLIDRRAPPPPPRSLGDLRRRKGLSHPEAEVPGRPALPEARSGGPFIKDGASPAGVQHPPGPGPAAPGKEPVPRLRGAGWRDRAGAATGPHTGRWLQSDQAMPPEGAEAGRESRSFWPASLLRSRTRRLKE